MAVLLFFQALQLPLFVGPGRVVEVLKSSYPPCSQNTRVLESNLASQSSPPADSKPAGQDVFPVQLDCVGKL